MGNTIIRMASRGTQELTQAQGVTPVNAVLAAADSDAHSSQDSHSSGGLMHIVQEPEYEEGAPNVLNDWTARISYNKHELGGSCFMLIFLGEVPEDPLQWRKSRSLVGLHYASVSAAIQYDNRRDQVAGGFVHLNWAIAERSGLSSPLFEPSVIVPYLKDNLHWRIQAIDRTGVELGRLPSLEVTVVATPLTDEPGVIFPIAGELQYYHHITYGRRGGSHHWHVHEE